MLAVLLFSMTGSETVFAEGAVTPRPEGRFGRQLMMLDEPLDVPDYAFQERSANGAPRERAMVDYRGGVVLLNFWATWCGVCARELPKLNGLAQEFEAAGVTLIPLSIDDSLETAARTLKKRGLTDLGVFLDTGSLLYSVLGLRGVPTTLVVGPDGKALAIAQGPANWDSPEALNWLRKLAADAPPVPAAEPLTTAAR